MPPPPRQPLHKTTFVVVDVETTGMSAEEDRITEIAMIKVRGGKPVDEFSTLVNPLITIPAFITNLTGIDNVMVQDAPPAREVVPFVLEFLGDDVFVAHNAPFDWGFVSQTVKREQSVELTNPRVCTVRLSRRLLPTLPSKSLGLVAQHLDVQIPQRHRASGDAYATSIILIKYLGFLQDHCGISTLQDLLAFQSSPRTPMQSI
ncbi:MAG: hypothetical protein FJ215_09700 [Ignavibacteria bacterium]|nr:hypothetical protein [Ignavibacteria bacterium]